MRHIIPFLNIFKDVAKYYKAPRYLNVLEIGVARGHSSRAFLAGLSKRNGPGGTLYSLDIQDCSKNIRPHLVEEYNKEKANSVFILADSKTYEWDKDIGIDVLFIDGDHSYDGAKNDYTKYINFLNNHAIILMHDVSHPRYGVCDAWNEVVQFPKIIWPLSGAGLGIAIKG
jgi:predicted O-methyltransferase YrrM